MVTRALIFDVDGTIVNSMPAHARSWDIFRQRYDIDMTVEEILRRTTGRNGVECIRELMGPHMTSSMRWRSSKKRKPNTGISSPLTSAKSPDLRRS